MRILLVTHLVPYPPKGGCSLRNFNLIKECSRQHEIHLLTFYQKAHLSESSNLAANVEEMRKYCKVVEVFDIPTDGKPIGWYSLLLANLFSLTPYSVWKFRSSKMREAIERRLQQHDYDLIEIGTIALANYRKLACHLPGLLVHHNIESDLLIRRGRSVANPLAKAYLMLQGMKLRRFERIACERFDLNTVVSDIDRKSLRSIYPDVKAEVVPNGVDVDYFKPGTTQSSANSLIYVGGMTWYPNLDAMLYFTREIWHLIQREVPDLSMTLIGRQPSSELAAFCAKNRTFKAVGFVDDVRPYVTDAAVFVVPLRVGGGTRLKILDAMAMGKAIVSTTIGCEGIEVTNRKDIVIADTADQIARETVKLLRDPARREELGKNARQTAERLYSWEVVYPRLDAVYEKLAAMKRY